MKGGRFEMPASLETVIAIVYIIILLTGLLLNLKQKFMAGFTFFLLLLFGRLINMYFARYAQRMLDGEIPIPENVHIDQLIDIIEQIVLIIEMFAFVILIIGLYKRLISIQRD